ASAAFGVLRPDVRRALSRAPRAVRPLASHRASLEVACDRSDDRSHYDGRQEEMVETMVSAAYRLSATAALLALPMHHISLGAPPTASAPATGPALDLDDLAPADAEILIQTARRAFDAAVRSRPPLISSYHPRSLRGRHARVAVTVRRLGRPIAQAV